jgi:hypothetical protein
MNSFLPKKHQTHFESLLRFVALAAIVVGYFLYMSWKFDAKTGAWLAALSWSFFVLCTPIADGGFVIAFPLRLLFGVRMVKTQIAVWGIAIIMNLVAINYASHYYTDSAITRLLYKILMTVWPYWSILILSASGTALSIWFGDEMLDVTKHTQRQKHHQHGFKHRSILIFGLGLLTVVAYYNLISSLGVEIPK